MPIKILFLNHGTEMGGAEVVLLKLLEKIDKSKFECWLIAPTEGELIDRAKDIPELMVRVIKFPRSFLVQRRIKFKLFSLLVSLLELIPCLNNLLKFARDGNFNLIYTNSVKAHIYGSIIGKLLRIPVVWRAHDIFSTDFYNPVYLKVIKIIANWAPRKIMCVSKSVLDSYVMGGVFREKLCVIRNGIQISCDKELDVNTNFEFSSEAKFLIGWFGRITFWKGLDVFIDAVLKILPLYPFVEVLIVGGPLYETEEYLNHIKDVVGKSKYANHIIFMGYQPNVLSIMSRVNILVHTSILPDPLPTVVLEAAALGKAIIAANSGGVPEIIRDGLDGRLVPPGDIIALENALTELISDQQLCEEFGKSAQEQMNNEFGMDKYIQSIESELLAILF